MWLAQWVPIDQHVAHRSNLYRQAQALQSTETVLPIFSEKIRHSVPWEIIQGCIR